MANTYAYRSYGTDLLKLLPSVEISRKMGMFHFLLNNKSHIKRPQKGRHNRVRLILDATLDRSWYTEYEGLGSPSAKQEWATNKIKEMTVIQKVR
jgi:hypothetical protein